SGCGLRMVFGQPPSTAPAQPCVARLLPRPELPLNEQPDKAVEVFLDLVEFNPDAVETYMALGSLFRRRGEIDRAIRFHKHIISRSGLDEQQRTRALRELGEDYMQAGLLDRAE